MYKKRYFVYVIMKLSREINYPCLDYGVFLDDDASFQIGRNASYTNDKNMAWYRNVFSYA